MRTFPAALERLSEQFARLPGIGSKTAQRVHLRLRLRPFDLQHGALKLCLIAALCLRVVGSEKRHIKRNEQRRE